MFKKHWAKHSCFAQLIGAEIINSELLMKNKKSQQAFASDTSQSSLSE